MLGLLLPLFISLLVTPSKSCTSAEELVVHRHILKTLVSIGPLYPVAFKNIMSSCPELKLQLESAIKSSKDHTKSKGTVATTNRPQQQPTIKLKMDFSNFK